MRTDIADGNLTLKEVLIHLHHYGYECCMQMTSFLLQVISFINFWGEKNEDIIRNIFIFLFLKAPAFGYHKG